MSSVWIEKRRVKREIRWYVGWRNNEGKKFTRRVKGDRAQANRVKNQINQNLEAGKFGLPTQNPLTLRELVDYWIDTYVNRHHSPKNADTTRGRIEKHLAPLMGKQADSISSRDLDELFVTMIDSGLSPASCNRLRAHVQRMYSDGQRWELVTINPAKETLKHTESTGRLEWYRPEEVQALLDAAKGEFKALLAVAVYTGMRRGEIFNLCWRDVDIEHGWITVTVGSESGTTKSKKPRHIPIHPELQEVFAWLSRDAAAGSYVFPRPDGGKRVDIRKAWMRTIEDAGIRKLRFHDLRHTAASLMVASGMNILHVKEILGHSSLKMTLRYAHLAPEATSDSIGMVKIRNSATPLF